MRTQLLRAMLLANCVGFASGVAAQDTTSARLSDRFIDTQSGLSLDTAIRQALEREPTLRSVRSEVEVAQGKRLQATLRPNPTVSIEQRQEPTSPDNQTMAQVQWPLDLFRRPARVAVADRAIEVSERAVEDRTRRLPSATLASLTMQSSSSRASLICFVSERVKDRYQYSNETSSKSNCVDM